MELSETLEKVRDGFLEKSADVEALQKKADDQVTQYTQVGQGFRGSMMEIIVAY